MVQHREPDLIERICEGKGRRFDGIPCEYYIFLEKICRLLQQHKLDEFWEQGRCAYTVLQLVEEGCLKSLREVYDGIPLGDSIDYDMQAVIQRLKQQHLETGFNLAVWHRYVHTTVYREIRKQIDFIPDKKHCGTCKHLSKSTSYVCLQRGEIREDLAYVCQKYRPKSTFSEPPEREQCSTCDSLSRKSYFCYKRAEKRNKTDAICEYYSQEISSNMVSLNNGPVTSEGSANTQYLDRLLYEISQTNGDYANSPETQLSSQDELLFMQKVLQERIETVSSGTKKYEMYERQYRLFISLLFKLYEDMSEEEAIKSLAQEYHLKEWTIKRDIKDVREFLKNVLK